MKKLSHKTAIHLNSEALKKINYDEHKHILEATFSNGRTYQYTDVPEKIWKDFLNAIKSSDSAGAFINHQIKPFYKWVEITK